MHVIKKSECCCNELECPICWDYSTHGYCKKCGARFGIAELDDGECGYCGSKDIKDGDFQ